jgi:hypothetical protein
MAPTETPTAAPITAEPTGPTPPPTAEPIAPIVPWRVIGCTQAPAATPSTEQFSALLSFSDSFDSPSWVQINESNGAQYYVGMDAKFVFFLFIASVCICINCSFSLCSSLI